MIAPHMTEDELRVWLARVEGKLDDMREEQLRHRQTLFGPTGDNGLASDVRELKRQARAQGMIPAKTLWTAITAVATVTAVMVTVMLTAMEAA